MTLHSGVSECGENVSTLDFAARASKVKVCAKRNEHVDFKALYHTALEKCDSKDDVINKLEIKVNTLTEQLQSAKVCNNAHINTRLC